MGVVLCSVGFLYAGSSVSPPPINKLKWRLRQRQYLLTFGVSVSRMPCGACPGLLAKRGFRKLVWSLAAHSTVPACDLQAHLHISILLWLVCSRMRPNSPLQAPNTKPTSPYLVVGGSLKRTQRSASQAPSKDYVAQRRAKRGEANADLAAAGAVEGIGRAAGRFMGSLAAYH